MVFDASLADWVCYECQQKRGEVSGGSSPEIVFSETPPNHAHFDSTLHRPVGCSKSLLWTNRKFYYSAKYKSLKKRFKRKSNLWPIATRRPIATNTDHAKSLHSCETIGAETTKGSNDGNQHFEHENVAFNIEHPRPPTVNMVTTSTSPEKSEDVPYKNGSLDSDDVQPTPRVDYVLSRTSCLSEAQKERVIAFIRETKPEVTVFVSVIGKSNVQLPGPYLGISKEYAFAYFPHESAKVTLQRPGMSNTWRLLFYKRNESGKNMLMGQWLDFVRDNSVQEGDICLIEPTNDERRSLFTVHLLRASAARATSGDDFQGVDPYSGESAAKIASEFHNKEEPSNAKQVASERVPHEISHNSLESEDSDVEITPPYIMPCRHDLSKLQKKIIEARVRAIQSEIPIYVTVMKNNNAGAAQRWMLELGVRFAGVYLPSCGQTVVLQRMGKTWITQMVIHNGRRWFLNGGWTKFARDNGLRVDDVCLFELKKNERDLTMDVHIIYREQFLVCN